MNNSGVNHDDDDTDDGEDDTSRFLHHDGTVRDSFLSSRTGHCARQNGDLRNVSLEVTDSMDDVETADRLFIFFMRYEIIEGAVTIQSRGSF